MVIQQAIQSLDALHVLLLCDSNNCMTQRVALHLRLRGHVVSTMICPNSGSIPWLVQSAIGGDLGKPDVIICPYLTRLIPESIYKDESCPCLIIHPGIEGDRGISSLDWALMDPDTSTWGVTILQAEQEIDAGPIWATRNFTLPSQGSPWRTKSNVYRTLCVDAAIICIDQVLDMLITGGKPRPLDYSNPDVRGMLRRRMIQKDRRLDFANMTAAEIARIICAADSQPGVRTVLHAVECFVYGAHVESRPDRMSDLHCGAAGNIIEQRDGAILVRCASSTYIWISHVRTVTSLIKLPAWSTFQHVLPSEDIAKMSSSRSCELLRPMRSFPLDTFQDVWLWCPPDSSVVYVWFDFYNGAMSASHSQRLLAALESIDTLCPHVKLICLMGGHSFFSNGIDLNTIEAASSPTLESYESIVAIDDAVRCVLRNRRQMTVSAMLGNAGAGGVMIACAADEVWTHAQSMLLPSYRAMDLYGSEYWTHTLRRRMRTPEETHNMLQSTEPITSEMAMRLGLVDHVLCAERADFLECVIRRAENLVADSEKLQALLSAKCTRMGTVEKFDAEIEACRAQELDEMKVCFKPGSTYHTKRHQFVTKGRRMPACLVSDMSAPIQPTFKDDNTDCSIRSPVSAQ